MQNQYCGLLSRNHQKWSLRWERWERHSCILSTNRILYSKRNSHDEETSRNCKWIHGNIYEFLLLFQTLLKNSVRKSHNLCTCKEWHKKIYISIHTCLFLEYWDLFVVRIEEVLIGIIVIDIMKTISTDFSIYNNLLNIIWRKNNGIFSLFIIRFFINKNENFSFYPFFYNVPRNLSAMKVYS